MDLFWPEHGKNWAIELKYADAPRLTRSMRIATEDLALEHLWVVYPGDRAYPLAEKIRTLPLSCVGANWSYAESGRGGTRAVVADDRGSPRRIGVTARSLAHI